MRKIQPLRTLSKVSSQESCAWSFHRPANVSKVTAKLILTKLPFLCPYNVWKKKCVHLTPRCGHRHMVKINFNSAVSMRCMMSLKHKSMYCQISNEQPTAKKRKNSSLWTSKCMNEAKLKLLVGLLHNSAAAKNSKKKVMRDWHAGSNSLKLELNFVVFDNSNIQHKERTF